LRAEDANNGNGNKLLMDTAHAPGGIMVYYADGDEEILHVNRYVVELLGCNTIAEFMDFTGGTFRGFVRESEIDRVENAIWQQVQIRSGFDHVYYQIETKDGSMVSVDDYGKLVEQDGGRPVFYVFLAEVDREEARDWLTGLPELPHFKHLAALEMFGMHDDDELPSILVFDLMGMKNYNATYGRKGGDVLLCGFADVLRRHFNPDACCRHAGDRFFVFAPANGINSAIQAVFDDFAASGIEGVLPVMAGACTFYPGDDVSTVLDRARLACDSDSNTWSSHITWFNDDMRAEAELRAYVLEHLDQAIANRWLRPFYQPIMRAPTGRVCCEEALARWIDPKYGLLAPQLFIPVLEKAGLLQRLDMHIVDCVLEDFDAKRKSGTPIAPVSVNISLRDLGEVDVAHVIARKVREAGVSPSLLKVEFTESAATSNPEQLRAQIEILHEAGISVWADDFGSGYSSLNTIGEFDFDLLKIDMELVRHLDNKRVRAIVAGVVQVASSLGIVTLAEGVETLEQVRFLKSAGCTMLQGYYYSDPQPLDVVEQRFREGRGLRRENVAEYDYWNKIGLFDLQGAISKSDDWKGEGSILELPTAIIEHRGTDWTVLRTNAAYEEFLIQTGGLDERGIGPIRPLTDDDVDPDFALSVGHALRTGTWERVSGQLEYGTGLQFFTKHVASTDGADAFVNASVSSMLGSALGVYGDIPVAYAVFRVLPNEGDPARSDMEYVYANDEYCDYVGVEQSGLPGNRFRTVENDDSDFWIRACYRAAILKEKVHDVIVDSKTGHRICFNVAPASVDGCCALVFSIADK